MEIYIFVSLFLSFAYIFIILRYIEGWKSLLHWHLPPHFQPQTKVSVIIPARNESENIQKCVHSVINQNYPAHLLEIIVIDDHSTDDTLEKIKALKFPNLKILELKNFIQRNSTNLSFKKKAIEFGIKKSTGKLIVTTDADCEAGKNWLALMVSFFEKKQYKFIAAPVNFKNEKSLLEKFQSLDFLGMMCVTGAGIHRRFMNMCNGANLAYERKAFDEVNGFEGIDRIASGDDILLMQKMAKKFPHQIGFLKNKSATVFTQAMPNLSSFIQQRIRWASKSGNYIEIPILLILTAVFLFCVNILFSLALLPFFFSKISWILLMQLIAKSIADFFFLRMMCRFFGREDLMKIFFPSQILHIIYIAGIGFLGNFKKTYRWKDRHVQ